MNFKEDVNDLLHRLTKKPFSKRKLSLKRDLLTALLTYSDAEVNGVDEDKLTPLHFAAKVIVMCITHESCDSYVL